MHRLTLLRVVVFFVQEDPTERNDRVGVGARGIGDEQSQIGRQIRRSQSSHARLIARQHEISVFVLETRHVQSQPASEFETHIPDGSLGMLNAAGNVFIAERPTHIAEGIFEN